MYANDNYLAYFERESLPDSLAKSDTLAIETALFSERLSCDIGLDSSPLAVFEPHDALLARDLAAYALSEETDRVLKTSSGMYALRGHSNANVDGRFFILFVASTLRSAMFHATRRLREQDRKNYTITVIVRELHKIEALADGKTGRYGRRYKLTARQKAILSCLELSANDVDDFAKIPPVKLDVPIGQAAPPASSLIENLILPVRIHSVSSPF